MPRDPKDRRYARKTPCEECPFNKNTEKPFSGGSPPEVYVGQICGPFLLSCHKDPDYNPGPENRGQLEIMQCAGAAIFRANVGVAGLLPPAMHSLPEDHEASDSTFAEFVARQRGISVLEAEEILKKTPPESLLMVELGKCGMDRLLLIAEGG